jgi:hypothetical protein
VPLKVHVVKEGAAREGATPAPPQL